MVVSGQTMPVTSHQLDTSELVELLQQSAVQHLTAFRQLEAQEFGSLDLGIVTTDFEALYAYKRGEYQRCLLLSTHNVHTLIGVGGISCVFTYPEFIQLMDDDIVSFIETFKFLTGRERVDSSKFFELSETTSGLRCHCLQLYKQRCCTTVRQCFINSWNRLPQDVVEATSVNINKKGMDKHWKDMGVYSWLALQLIISNRSEIIGLTLIVYPSCREDFDCVSVSQLYLSLYLMTQCQMKLHHSVTSLAQTLDYVEVTRRYLYTYWTLDQLLLILTERKILLYISRELG